MQRAGEKGGLTMDQWKERAADLALEKRNLEKIIAGSRARIKEIDSELDELMKQTVELAREGKL